VMTRSRGALAVAAFLVPTLVVWVAFSRSKLAGLITLGAVVLVVVAFAVVYSLVRGNVAPQVDALLNPFGEEVRMNARVSSLEMVGDFPLFGTGLGTYGDVFPAYKVRGPDLYFAHCDLLQWFAETGLVGLALGLGILGVGFWTVVSGYRKLKDRFFRRLLIAVTVAAAAFLLHGLVDFPMEIPGVMIVFVALCAAAFVIARDQIARYEKDDFLY
jgi:putative inorganic carbon (hco3(-)) transporter